MTPIDLDFSVLFLLHLEQAAGTCIDIEPKQTHDTLICLNAKTCRACLMRGIYVFVLHSCRGSCRQKLVEICQHLACSSGCQSMGVQNLFNILHNKLRGVSIMICVSHMLQPPVLQRNFVVSTSPLSISCKLLTHT